MDLVLTLEKQNEDNISVVPALAIAMQCYLDLQTPYGFAMRRENILDVKRLQKLIKVFRDTKEGDLIELNLKDMLLLITAFDITLKSLSSQEPYRFIPILEDDAVKRATLMSEIILTCSEMTTELSEQAMYRYEVGQQRRFLTRFEY
ncbi:MAG: hypothetical protein KBF73_08610 [Flavobacteriales bacterium]|nr:hypothetical protein [Flavobacteriales bacterium]